MQKDEAVCDKEETENADLLQELTCTLCFDLFYEPTTLRCGHTFCFECIQKSISRKNECPICREVNTYLPKASVVLRNICKQNFPKQYEERDSAVQQKRSENPSRILPLFILEPLLPFQEMTLYIFEDRYRGMIARCLENDMLFGMRDSNDTNFGVEVRITRYVPQPDGRSIVNIKSLRRIEIEQITTHHDGYAEGRVVNVRDSQENVDQEALSNLRDEISQKMTEWIELAKQKRGDSRVSQILRNLGLMPQDSEDHSFWLCALLNPLPHLSVCNEIRVEALELKDTKRRYELIKRTIENSMKYMDQPFIGSRGVSDWLTYFIVCAMTIFAIWVCGLIFQDFPSVSQLLWDLLGPLIS